jgi:hypothetical protein
MPPTRQPWSRIIPNDTPPPYRPHPPAWEWRKRWRLLLRKFVGFRCPVGDVPVSGFNQDSKYNLYSYNPNYNPYGSYNPYGYDSSLVIIHTAAKQL